MISTRWIEKRRPHWNRLEQLVNASGRSGVSALSPTDLQELALLYRQIAADLASVREDSTSTNLAHYLNQLLGRAHNIIYMGRKTDSRNIFDFLPLHLSRHLSGNFFEHACRFPDFSVRRCRRLPAEPQRSFLPAPHSRSRHDAEHRTAQDVDGFDCDRQAGGLQPNSHQQFERFDR